MDEARRIAEMLGEEERKLICMGDDLRLFLPFLPTKKLVGRTFFHPGVLIDSSYQDFESLKDPARSDMPAMKRMEARGLVEARGQDWVGFSNGQDGDEWRWRRTALGRAVAQELEG